MFSLGRWSCRIQPGFLVSRPTRENKYKVNVAFVYAAITLFRGTFQLLLLATPISYLIRRMIVPGRKSDPSNRSLNSLTWSFVNSQPLDHIRLSAYSYCYENEKGLGSSRFARHYSENRYLLSFPRPTKMFQFRRFPFNYPMYSGRDNMT